jgi:hypothetical protein
MTKKEHLIDMLYAHAPSTLSKDWVEKIFDVINKRDWAIFCSQMGGRNHPMERVYAEKKYQEEREKLCAWGYAVWECVEYIERNLTRDIYSASKFYKENFHTLNEEYNSR